VPHLGVGEWVKIWAPLDSAYYAVHDSHVTTQGRRLARLAAQTYVALLALAALAPLAGGTWGNLIGYWAGTLLVAVTFAVGAAIFAYAVHHARSV
jgi:hypothetical protein